MSVTISDRWIVAQRVALGCTLLRCGFWDYQKQILGQLSPTPRLPEGHEAAAYQMLLESLPPTTLKALCSLPRDRLHWGQHAPLWEQAATWQETPGRKGVAPIAAARIIADRLLNSNLSPAQLNRLASLELDVTWPDGAAAALQRLRARLRAGGDRIEAITECGPSMQGRRWSLVENDLLQREFAWPLVVGKDTHGGPVECSLPIEVEVFLDAPPAMNSVTIKGTGLIDCEGWRRPVHKALAAAKELWEYKHTSWDRKFAEQIKSAKLVLDVRVAERIVEPYRDWFQFSLTDDSLEAYIASIIFSRFFGHSAVDTICATGALGKKLPDKNGSDFLIRSVGSIPQKIAYAENAFFFDQIIIPGSGEAATEFRPGLRISKGKRLSDYVEHVAGQVWHKHRWVRTPDLYLAYKRYRTDQYGAGVREAPEDSRQIQQAVELLRASEEPVLELPVNITPENAAAALYKVISKSTEGGTNNRSLAHFTVVRAVDGEGNDRFWQTVWEALEGGSGDFERLGLFASTEEVGRLIAGRLNWFRPNPDYPRRAPDILMIVGHNRLPPARGISSGPDARLHLDRLVPVLDARLNPSPIPAVRDEIGYTRILLVHEEAQTDQPGRGSPALGDSLVSEGLRRLSVFRNGFTWEMARRMLSLDDLRFSEVLSALLAAQHDGEPVVIESTGAVEFFVNRRATLPDGGTELANLHFLAANAIVGFLKPDSQGHRLDIGLGLSARWCHEAQWHLERAARLESKSVGPRKSIIRNRYRSAHERLNRIAQPLTHSRLRWAVERSNEESLDTWDALEAKVRAEKQSIHPLDLLWAAKFADKLRKSNPGRADELAEARDRYVREAMKNCHEVPTNEAEACRFVVASTWATLLMRERPDLDGWKRARGPNGVALRCRGKAQQVYDTDWFEFAGDGEGDYPNLEVWSPQGRVIDAMLRKRDELARRAAGFAAPLYRAAFWNQGIQGAERVAIQYVVKWLGALEEAQLPIPREDWHRIIALPSEPRKWFALASDKPHSGLFLLPSVRRRWARGYSALERIWREG